MADTGALFEGLDPQARGLGEYDVADDEDDQTLDLNLGDLDLTTEDIDFDEIDEEITKFSNDPLVKEALDKGVDLKIYGRQIEADLRQVERDSVQDYMTQSDNLATLHHEIKECDQVLESMENLLCGFQAHLGTISDEIRHLQEESLSMNVKVRNRKAVQNKLAAFVEDTVLPPSLIRNICEQPVDEEYLLYLVDLNKKIAFNESRTEAERASVASADVLPELERLKNQAVLKLREFLLTKVQALRKPRTNIQILQNSQLLKFRYFQEFLNTHAPEIAYEIQSQYAQTVSKIFHNYLKGYTQDLMKLQAERMLKGDLIGGDEGVSKGMFSWKSPSSSARDRGNVFALGRRGDLLGQLDQPCIVAHAAASGGEKFPYEQLFRSMSFLLMDTATSEYLFDLDFFGRPEMFVEIFGRTLTLFREILDAFLFQSHDPIAVLLMIRITHHFQLTMSRRRVPCLDNYFDRVVIMLWPKFKTLFDAQLESVQRATPKGIFNNDTLPVQLTRRYADLIAAVNALNAQYSNDMIVMGLSRLRVMIEKLLARASQFHKDPKRRIIFLLNNYELIVRTLNEQSVPATPDQPGQPSSATAAAQASTGGFSHSGASPTTGLASCQDALYWQEAVDAQTGLFVEEELRTCANGTHAKLIQFVHDTESLVTSMSGEELGQRLNTGELESIVRDFAGKWKDGMKSIDRDVANYFPPGDTAMSILKRALTQLTLYYERLLTIVKHVYRNNPPFGKYIIPQSVITFEIKAIVTNKG